MCMAYSCVSTGNLITKKSEWTFDNYLLEIQKNTSNQRYNRAILLLHELQLAFPEQEKIMVNYLIAYNYYCVKGYVVARNHFTKVKELYNNLENQGEIAENEKFVVLSDLVISKIDDAEAHFDPYRVREEMESKGKKLKPQKG